MASNNPYAASQRLQDALDRGLQSSHLVHAYVQPDGQWNVSCDCGLRELYAEAFYARQVVDAHLELIATLPRGWSQS